MELIRGAKVKDFWNQEHSLGPGFKELSGENPSLAVTKFADYLRSKQIPLQGRMLEIGCGTGRNTNWLAQQGFDVVGVDISDVAIDKASMRAGDLGLEVEYRVLDVTAEWPFPEGSMDYVADILTSQLFSSQQRGVFIEELRRVLKPGGKLLMYALDRTKDKEAQKLIKKHPGPDRNSYVISDSGLVETTFSLDEIAELYFPLAIEASELVFFPSKYKGKTYNRYFWWVVLEK